MPKPSNYRSYPFDRALVEALSPYGQKEPPYVQSFSDTYDPADDSRTFDELITTNNRQARASLNTNRLKLPIPEEHNNVEPLFPSPKSDTGKPVTIGMAAEAMAETGASPDTPMFRALRETRR